MLEVSEKRKLEQFQHEIKMLEESKGVNAGRGMDNQNLDSQSGGKAARYPKMPYFNESKDDMDAYLCRFEAFATDLKWKKEQWSMFLGVHLQGSALSVYHSLCVSGSVEYDILRRALLTKFLCTKDGYRDRFRGCKPDADESFLSYATRFAHLFDRWIDMADIEITYAGLRDLMLCEQILAAVSKDLAVFLRERNLKTSQELIEAAENYRLAHPNKCMAKGAKVELGMIGQQVEGPQTPRKQYAGQPATPKKQYFQQFQQQPSTNQFCPSFQEQQYQHFDSSSRAPRYRGRGPRGLRGQRGQRGDRGASNPNWRDAMLCYECQGVGHTRRECPTFLNRKRSESPKRGNVSFAVQDDVSPEVLCSATTHRPGTLPMSDGIVNGFQVSVLRDSGATTAGVRKALVRPDQFLGQTQKVISFGGNLEVFPLASVDVDTAYFSGPMICCVIDEPIADLILGNVEGVSPIAGLILGDVPRVAAAVETRAQKKADQKATVDLNIPMCDLSLSTKELISLQEQDVSLQKFQDMATSGERVEAGKSSYSFKKKNCVLFRTFMKDKVHISQIVTPTAVREKVLFAAHDGLLAGHCGVRKTRFRVQNRLMMLVPVCCMRMCRYSRRRSMRWWLCYRPRRKVKGRHLYRFLLLM
jgi:hypothetical protein